VSQTVASLNAAKNMYEESGWYRSSARLGGEILDRIRLAVDELSREERPSVVYEKEARVVRAIHGCHLYDEAMAKLVRFPLFVQLAEALVGDSVYVYQFKVNLKQSYEGAAWPWHQDFAFWKFEDGMPEDRAVNIAVLIDDTDEHNGPLRVLSGSHRLGLVGVEGDADTRSGDWRNHVSADLEHTVPLEYAECLKRKHESDLITGPAGSVYAFHPSIVHASSSNLSPSRRAMLLITYNAISNAVHSSPRPEFLVGTDLRPVIALADNRL
jgi:ectoine hydroxylase